MWLIGVELKRHIYFPLLLGIVSWFFLALCVGDGQEMENGYGKRSMGLPGGCRGRWVIAWPLHCKKGRGTELGVCEESCTMLLLIMTAIP